MMIIGSDVFARSDIGAIKEQINTLAKNTNLINKEEKWNGINILHRDQGRVNLLEVGVKAQKRGHENCEVLILLGEDDIKKEDIPEGAFVIYIGHTGDEGASFADLILPGSSYIEK